MLKLSVGNAFISGVACDRVASAVASDDDAVLLPQADIPTAEEFPTVADDDGGDPRTQQQQRQQEVMEQQQEVMETPPVLDHRDDHEDDDGRVTTQTG